jgi:hypothetical protein
MVMAPRTPLDRVRPRCALLSDSRSIPPGAARMARSFHATPLPFPTTEKNEETAVHLHRIVRLRALAAIIACAGVAACQSSTDFLENRVISINRVSGDAQTGSVANALAQPLIVRALDSRGLGVPGVSVEWKIASGGGSVTVVNGNTDADGRSTANWTLGTATGTQTVTAAVGPISTIFTATATVTP